jgi:hypothetical protein
MVTVPPSPIKLTPLDWIFRVLGFVTMTAVAFTLPLFPTLELDASWRMALGKFFMEGRQFGHDIVFTYGPLGWTMGKTYWGSHLGALIVWHAVQATVFAGIVFWHAFRLTGYSRVFCLVFFFLFGLSYQDAMHQSIIAFAGLELVRRSHNPWRWSSVALLVLLATLSLVKFTNLLLGFFLVLLAGALELWHTRRYTAARLPALFLLLFLLGWMLCGQSLLNLPGYFVSSWQISQGYQDAMGLACPPQQLYLGLSVVVLINAYLLVNLATSANRVRGVALTLGALALLYLNWKHGFIRADGHQIGFYYAVLTIVVTAPLLLEDTARLFLPKKLLLAAAGLVSLFSMETVLPGLVRGALAAAQDKINVHVAFAMGQAYPPELYEGRMAAERNTVDLKKTKAVVGDASLDVLGFEQAVAIYNSFNFQPRPVFQGYSAYTPYLSRLNYDYYASDRAPEFVLFKLQTIDGRLATMDDPHVLRLLTHRYTYLFSEQGYSLWQRKPGDFDAAAFEPKPIRTATHQLGETISVADLADQNIWVEIDYRFNLLGKLRRFLFRPPLVNLHIIDDKGVESVHRLPQPIGRAGFMLSPVINDILDFMRASGGVPSRRAASIRIVTAPQDRDCLKKEVKVSFSSMVPSDAGKDYFKNADQAKFHMFLATPISYEALNPPNEDAIDKRTVMIMHAPSHMVFEVPAGATMVEGSFGFVTGAYQQGGRTNGAQFVVYWSDGSDRMILHERYLDPLNRLNDRGLQHFSARLPKGSGHVTFRIDPGEYGEFAFDWTGWTGIQFK